jgi:hypothetical protein
MIINKPLLPPKVGYVEVEINGIRKYKNVTTGYILGEEPKNILTTEERISILEEQIAQADETAIELYEANLAQEEINAAQDDALIELYELIGG